MKFKLFLVLFFITSNILAQDPKSLCKIPDGVYYIVSYIDRSYVIDNSSSNVALGNNIQLWKRNNTNAQKWRIENRDGGIVFHSLNNEDYVIDNSSSRTYNGNNIVLYAKNGTNAQLWYPEKAGLGLYYYVCVLRSANNTNFVMDLSASKTVNGNNIQLWGYNKTDAQKWIICSASVIELLE